MISSSAMNTARTVTNYYATIFRLNLIRPSFAMSAFAPPEFWSFRPFFTIQPVTETREKQLKLWKDLILQYCLQNKCYKIVPSQFPFFKNPAIDRELSADAINTIINYLIKSGNLHHIKCIYISSPFILYHDHFNKVKRNGKTLREQLFLYYGRASKS